MKIKLQAQTEKYMVHHWERSITVFGAFFKKKSSQSNEIKRRIEKYIDYSNSTAHSAYTKQERFIIDADDGKWFYLTVGKHISFESNTLSWYTYVGNGVTIYLVEQIDASKEYKDYAEEIGTKKKTHNNNSDNDGRCNSIPIFSSF